MRVKRAHLCSRFGLLVLPEDVLAVILRHLDHLPSLMAVRLVCRLLRKVSYSVITSLNVNTNMPDVRLARPGVEAQLKALPYLTRLCLHGELQDRCDLLAVPRFASLLRELDIDLTDHIPEAAQDFFAEVKCATGITALTCWSGAASNGLLPCLLASCPHLAWLHVRSFHALPAAFCAAIMQLTGLCTLRIVAQPEQLWEDLLPRLTTFPRLRDLGEVHVDQEAMSAKIGAFSQLTRLEISVKGSKMLGALTRITALEALRVGLYNSAGTERVNFGALPRGMSQLTELTVTGNYLFSGFGEVVAPLNRLVVLHLSCLAFAGWPVAILREAPLHGLRHLTVKRLKEGSPSEMHAVFSALTGLEKLSLVLPHGTGTALYEHLRPLTRLTALHVFVHRKDSLHCAPARVPATFLTGLTGLTELTLHNVLAYNAKADIRCLALLTRLRRLKLQPFEVGGYRFYTRLSAITPRPAVLDRRHFEPLRALRWLEAWDLNQVWPCAGRDAD